MGIARRLQSIGKKLNYTHCSYLLLYLVIFVIGILLVTCGGGQFAGTVAMAVGGSLIAAAMVGWILFLNVWLSQEASDRWEALHRFGLIRAFEHRSIPIKKEYDARLADASKAIDIMGFGLRSLREDYAGDFGTWAKRAHVRILLLDPEFPTSGPTLATQRDSEEGAGNITDDVHEFITKCSELLRTENSNFCIRLFRCLPSINIFRIDGILFWGPYLVGDVSRRLPTFLVDERGVLFERFMKHFDMIWSDKFSRPVPDEWLKTDAEANAG